MDAKWHKSSFSFSNGNCVEVAELPGECVKVGVRDTQDREGPVLRFSPEAWREFTARVRR